MTEGALAQSSAAAIAASILAAVCVLMLSWVAKLLWNVTLSVRRLTDAMYPERRDSLPDQVEAVRDEVVRLRLQGSDRLDQILGETRAARRAAEHPPDVPQ